MQWDGNPLGLGLVAEDKPSEFSCNMERLGVAQRQS